MANSNNGYSGPFLKICLPDGSLMKKDRGDMVAIMSQTGIGAVGYTLDMDKPYAEPKSNFAWLNLFTGRPQDMAPMIRDQVYDGGFSGDDWMMENEGEAKAVIDLCTGRVIVAPGIPIDPEYNQMKDLDQFLEKAISKGKKILGCTEYPGMAMQIYANNDYCRNQWPGKFPAVEYHGKTLVEHANRNNKINPHFKLLVTHGTTEEIAKRYRELGGEYEPIVFDNVQTSTAMRKAGFRPLKRHGVPSSAKLFMGSHVGDDTEKAPLAVKFMKKVDSAIYARTHSDVKMNVNEGNLTRVIEFLTKRHLYESEPTIVPPFIDGGKIYQINTIMQTDDPEEWENVCAELEELGAEGIAQSELVSIRGIPGKDYMKLLREGLSE